ncbi:MAG: prolipoprotein diacylglyceryl transferase [Chitinivibrionales bacterium]|nr:prolipoprotein diacylglyceryl transferase [Chitinivibrionales bacterium]
MHPYIFQFGRFVIPSYGLMLALSFLLGLWLSTYRAKQKGLQPQVIYDVGFWILLSAIIGSRLYYVILHFNEFKDNLLNIINPFQGEIIGLGGLVMLGGLIGATAAGYIYFSIKKLPFAQYADTMAPAIGFGIFLTRIGCFLNGCCYGKPTTSSCGIHFNPASPAGDFQLAVHADKLIPAQLIESLGGLLVGIILLWLGKRRFFDGFLFYTAGAYYAVLRFFIDFTRYYAPDETLFFLSHNQIICILLFIVFMSLIVRGFISSTNKPTTVTQSDGAQQKQEQ